MSEINQKILRLFSIFPFTVKMQECMGCSPNIPVFHPKTEIQRRHVKCLVQHLKWSVRPSKMD